VNFVPTDDCARLGESLEQLGACSLSLRQAVVQAGAAVIDADGMRTPDEIELLRVIAAALGCPVSLPA
jgi:tellurite resistance protein